MAELGKNRKTLIGQWQRHGAASTQTPVSLPLTEILVGMIQKLMSAINLHMETVWKNEFLPTGKTAQLMGVTPQTIRRRAERRKIKDDLERYMNSHGMTVEKVRQTTGNSPFDHQMRKLLIPLCGDHQNGMDV